MSKEVLPDGRERPDENAGERDALAGMLDFLRGTVVQKVDGLSEEQARSRPVAASDLTPAGIVKHLTAVERFWFSIDFAGLDLPWPWPEDDPHGCFPVSDDDTVAALVAEYEAECARARAAVAEAQLDDPARGPDVDFNLRYAYTHMIEETARHCGHLDLLRESIDGRRGQ